MPDKPPPTSPPVNPFLLALQGQEWIGRKELLQRGQEILKQIMPGKKTGLALYGLRGAGKSLALKQLAAMAERYGGCSLSIPLHEGDDPKSIVRKIREAWRLALPAKASPVPAAGLRSIYALFENLDSAAQKVPLPFLALLFDDFDALRDADGLLKSLSDALWKKEYATPFLVAVSGMHFDRTYHFDSVQLAEPGPAEAEHFLVGALERTNIRWGKECLHLLLEESGRNPFILLTMARVLYERLPMEEKQITKAHYLKRMPLLLQALVSLFDDLYYKTSPQERKLLRLLADGNAENISRIAQRLHISLNSATTLARRLVKKGSLVKVERGIYRLFNSMYGKYIRGR